MSRPRPGSIRMLELSIKCAAKHIAAKRIGSSAISSFKCNFFMSSTWHMALEQLSDKNTIPTIFQSVSYTWNEETGQKAIPGHHIFLSKTE